MKTMSNPGDRQQIFGRVAQLKEGDVALWGVMSVNQMVCHLNDSYALVLGKKTANTIRMSMPPAVLKWFALKLPLKWPKGVPTLPEVEQGKGGSRPIGFGKDRAALVKNMEVFCEGLETPCMSHPMFGAMSEADWMRWGYLHADHHLRQFGH